MPDSSRSMAKCLVAFSLELFYFTGISKSSLFKLQSTMHLSTMLFKFALHRIFPWSCEDGKGPPLRVLRNKDCWLQPCLVTWLDVRWWRGLQGWITVATFRVEKKLYGEVKHFLRKTVTCENCRNKAFETLSLFPTLASYYHFYLHTRFILLVF